LKAQIAKGLELKSDNTISGGFRIGTKDGNAFYDFSAEEVAGLFSAYLNPKTASLMKAAAEKVSADEGQKTPAQTEKSAVKAEKGVAKKQTKTAVKGKK